MGLLKAKLAKYRSQLLEPSKKSGEKGEGFDVLKSGDARVALIGFPSVGKVNYLLILLITFSLLYFNIIFSFLVYIAFNIDKDSK